MALKSLRTRLLLPLFALAVVMAALPAVAGAQAASTGRVRVMHASPDAPAVDIFVDGQKAVTALAFPKDTGYVSLPAGKHNVKVFISPSNGSGTPALQADLDIAGGKDYTVLAVGEAGKNTLALLPWRTTTRPPRPVTPTSASSTPPRTRPPSMSSSQARRRRCSRTSRSRVSVLTRRYPPTRTTST